MNTHEVIQGFAHKCCLSWGVPFALITGGRRNDPAVVQARKALAWMLRRQFEGASYPALGRILQRDHTSVISGERAFQRALDAGEPWALQALREASQQVAKVVPNEHYAFLTRRFERCA